MAMYYLREYPKLKTVATTFQISRSTAHREIESVTETIFYKYRTIEWPSNPSIGFEGTIGSIDCTPHPRNRVHPGQAMWYRGDKGYHFITAQVVCGPQKQIYAVHLGQGHNNDQGFFSITQMGAKLLGEHRKLLADGGYSHLSLVSPNNNKSAFWNLQQKRKRVVIEWLNAYIKLWGFAKTRNRNSPEFQSIGLLVVYEIANALIHDGIQE
jgi:hypothetical protein